MTKRRYQKRKPFRKKNKSLLLQARFAIAAALLILLSPFYYGYVLQLASSAWLWLRHPGEDKSYRTYESYGIKIPKKHDIHGIDVSYYQGKIDWQKVSAMNEDGVKIDFAFIKATEGILTVDPYFRRNWREAPKYGIKVGAYHFFRPQKSGLWQANFFLQMVSIEKGDLPPVIDVESLDGVTPEKLRKELNAFVSKIEERTHIKPIIYTGLKFYQSYLERYYQDYSFWVAHYHQPKLKLDDNAWKFWQHSDKASINGINHLVDFNAFNGDSVRFKNMLIP